MAVVTWKGKQFSMRPVDPAATGDNPVTRVLNMVLNSLGSVTKRRAFGSSGLPTGTQNHIIAEIGPLQGDPTARILVKAGAAIQQSSTGTSFTAVPAADTNDPLFSGGTPNVQDRGSFSLFSGEVYYCDRDTIWRWDGDTGGNVFRPGIVSLDGLDYLLDLGLGEGATEADIKKYGPPFGEGGDYPGQGGGGGAFPQGPRDAGLDPHVITPIDEIQMDVLTRYLQAGEKTLNTAFALSLYDPVRRIFGRRSETFALPYLFSGGSTPPTGITQLLSTARLQYSKVVSTPAITAAYLNGHTEYKCAIWFTRGFSSPANTSFGIGGGWWAASVWSPAGSKRMNELVFLEAIFELGLTGGDGPIDSGAVCKKDDSKLFASARYLDTYARPLPSKFMMILPNGTGVYFFPRLTTTRARERILDQDPAQLTAFSDFGRYAEYSISHPEQIGRWTETQRDTISYLPNLKGQPIRTISDGLNQFLFTSQAVYRVGFDGGVLLAEITGGRGVRSPNSIAQSPEGLFWMADEGVVWLRGGRMLVLDQELGFGDWFENLTPTQKESVTIGVAEGLNQILVFHTTAAGQGDAGERALVFDHQNDFASEFRGTGITSLANYAVYFRAAAPEGGRLLTVGNHYPGTGVAAETTQIEAWVSEELHRPKTAGFLTLDLGPHGPLTVTVEAHDQTDSGPEFASGIPARNFSVGSSLTSGERVRISDFVGMRGRMYRILIDGVSGTDWSINKMEFDYEFDTAGDARSV